MELVGGNINHGITDSVICNIRGSVVSQVVFHLVPDALAEMIFEVVQLASPLSSLNHRCDVSMTFDTVLLTTHNHWGIQTLKQKMHQENCRMKCRHSNIVELLTLVVSTVMVHGHLRSPATASGTCQCCKGLRCVTSHAGATLNNLRCSLAVILDAAPPSSRASVQVVKPATFRVSKLTLTSKGCWAGCDEEEAWVVCLPVTPPAFSQMHSELSCCWRSTGPGCSALKSGSFVSPSRESSTSSRAAYSRPS